MKQIDSEWVKSVRIKMIELGLSVNDLAKEVGYCRGYTSAILNGRVTNETARQTISDYLNLPNRD